MPKAMVYKKGAIIYFEGDKDERIFILQKGLLALKATNIETGYTYSEQVKPGEFFGTKSALGRFPREETVSVVADAICIAMTVAEFEQNFSTNKQVLMKMLRVFSSQLRQVHQQTEAILKTKANMNQQTGMATVAKAFYEDEKWRSCSDVCEKFIKRYPNSPNKPAIEKMNAIAKPRAERDDAKSDFSSDEYANTSGNSALRAFSLPAFSRFAKEFLPGQVIISEFEPGDSFYLIQSGQVQLVKCVNGANKNLDILKPGEFFGEMAILDNSARSATCLAKTKVQCLEFNKENFEVLVMGNPQLALILLKLFCKRIYDQKRRLKILCIKDVRARLADVFCMVDEMNPMTNPKDRSRRFNMTIQDVAHWAGLPLEVIREDMGKFSKQHLVEIGENVIIVNDIFEMRRIVDTRAQARV